MHARIWIPVLFVISLGSARWSHACDVVCVLPQNVERMLHQSERVLVGRVVDVSDENRISRFRLDVIRVWKGGGSPVSLFSQGGCGKRLEKGRVYLVVLVKGQEEIDSCSVVVGVWEQWTRKAVTRLDRLQGYPLLDLPAADLRPPKRAG
jgi:hypothetical protein